MHKEAAAVKGMLVVIVTEGYVTNLFSVTKLSRLLRIARTTATRRTFSITLKIKETEAQQKAALSAAEAQNRQNQRNGPACYVYFKKPQPQERHHVRRMLQKDQTHGPALLGC